MTPVIQNRKGALDAQIHMLKKLSADMGEHESSLNMLVYEANKHGVKVEVTPYYSYHLDIHTYPGGVKAELPVPGCYGWDVMLTANGGLRISKWDTMSQVIEFLKKEIIT